MAGLEEGYSSLTKIFRSATGEQGLTAVRSRSRENNTQLFSYTLVPLRYPDGIRSNANPRAFWANGFQGVIHRRILEEINGL